MIKKVLFPLGLLLTLLVSSNTLLAQCGLVVDIDAIPRAHICLGESVDLKVTTNLSTPIPAFCAINTNKTCGIGSDSINTTIGAGNSINAFNSSAPELFGDFGEAQSRSQIIILASELQATGFNGGKLTSLALDIARLEAGKNHTIPNFSIKIGCTSSNNFTNAFLTGLDQVYSPRTVTLSATGLMNFVFDDAYDWDGVGNLVIEFCYFTPTGTSASTANLGNFTRDHVPGFAAWRQLTTPSSTGTCAATGTEKNFNQRPNIKFNICRPKLVNLTYVWTPANGTLSSTTSGRPTATPAVDTRYVVSVTKIDDPTCTAKDSIDIVVEDPSLFTPTANTPTCVGSTLQFNANTTGVTYFWSGPNNFQSFSQNPSIPNVTTAASGTYVFQVDKGFCKATKSVDVVIEPIPVLGTAKDSTVCRSVTSVNLGGLLTGEDAGGTWIDDNASGILTGANINPSLLSNTTNVTYKYTYRIINSCGTFTKSVNVTVIPTKSPGIPDDTTICETGPGINLFTVLDGSPATGGFWTDNNASGQMTAGGIFTPTNLGGSTYTFDYTVIGSTPCSNASAKVTVVVADQPNAGNDANKNICTGTSVNLFAQLTGGPKTGGVWKEITASGGTLNTSTGDYTASGVAVGVYAFRYIVTAVAPCLADTSMVTVTVFDSPKITNLVSTCAPNQLTYTVSFNITGGQSSTYSVSPTGTITGSAIKTYTSPAIPDATQVTFVVSDGLGCGTATATVLKRCACPTQSGTVATSPALQVCNNGSATVNHTGGYFSDGNDTLSYVLHTSPTSTLGTILAMQSSPTFTYSAAYTYGTTYYVSAVAGNKLPSNLVDLTDQCLSVSVGVPIRFGSISQPSFTFSVNPACPGTDVNLTSTVAGSPTYSWTGPNGFARSTPNPTISPVTANSSGTYTLTVSSNGCSLSATDVLNVIPAPVVTVSSDASVCKGQGAKLTFNVVAPSQIKVTLTLSTGGGMQVDLNPGTTTITVSPSSTTTYSLVYATYNGSGMDGCGFNINGSTTIQVVPAPVLTYSVLGESIFCYNETANGVVQFQISPAQATNITYSINGTNQPTLNNINNGGTTTYSLQNNGLNSFRVEGATLLDGTCPLAISGNPIKFYKLIEPIVTANVNSLQVCDNDSVTLSFNVLASEKVGIRYLVNGSEFVLTTASDTSIKIAVPANTLIQVLDATYLVKSTCGKSIGQSFAVFSIPSPKPTIQVTGTACNNVNTGTITVTTPDAGDLFSLNGGGFSSNGNFTQLTSGIYQLIVKAANGCRFTEQVEIIAASNLVINTPVVNTSCGKADGSITIDILSGIEPYTILFNGANVNEGTISNLPAGNYSVLIIDGNNCVKQNQLVIKPSSPISINVVNSNQVDCTTPEYIETTIKATGGTGVFTYKMDADIARTDSVYLGLFPQTHKIVVSDDRGCTTTKVFLITAIQKFNINPQIVKPLLCWEDRDAIIRINTTNAASETSFSLDNLDYQTDNTFTGIGPGVFTIYVRELNGCRREQTVSFSVTRPDPIDLDINSFGEPSCFNVADGFVQLRINGGSSINKTFSSNGGGSYQSSPTIASLLKGDYIFLAEDENGCHSDTIYYTLTGPSDIVISGSFTLSGDRTKGTLTIEATGGNPGYLYSIDGVNFFSNPVFVDIPAGNYVMYVRDNNGCVSNKAIAVSDVGIGEIEGTTMVVYPNPFRDQLEISVDKGLTNVTAILLNALGEKVFEGSVQEIAGKPWMVKLPSGLSKGLYTLQLSSDQGRVNRKLINE